MTLFIGRYVAKLDTMTPDLASDIVAVPSFAVLPKERMRMKKEIGVLEGVAIILGIILGSGMIFKYFNY